MSTNRLHIRLNDKYRERLQVVADSIDGSLSAAVRYLIRLERNQCHSDAKSAKENATA